MDGERKVGHDSYTFAMKLTREAVSVPALFALFGLFLVLYMIGK